ncbi:MAG: galactonate dehydratase [Actinophytocola sp.]|uniref:galactonate dehydratase n=1 Tax=Actinophytocola sp. TaxID=1872138 RepID=UPI001327775D|nr:galactonate dehydratase [Actinophytocola sp.]
MVRGHRVAPRWIFVEVRTEEGLAGWGEAIVPKRAAAVLGAVEDLARNVVGADPSRIEELWQRMSRGGFFRDGPVLATASAAIEHALWDIKGRRHGLGVHEFLGGAVRDHVRLYAWVGGDRPNDVVAQVKARLDQGFTAVKMNATEELDLLDSAERVDAVVARVDAIRSAYGNTVDVALDFHGRVHRAMAKTLLHELAQYRLLWVEEPLPPGQEDLLPEIARHAGATPLATGERLLTRAQFARLLEMRVVDVIQPDVSLTGLFELEKICRMAEAYDVAVAPHCPNGPISLAASVQVDFCAGNVIIQEQSLGLHYNQGYAGLPPGEMADYLLDPAPLSPVDGRLPRPEGPGLGIEIDAEAVEARGADWTLADPVWRVDDGRYAEW